MQRLPFFVLLPVIAATVVCSTARRAETPPAPIAQNPTPPAAAQPAASQPVQTSAASARARDFDQTVKPILEKQCRPCHFTGGVMYEKLPFDRAETIHKLGEKLFTRIKNPEEQKTIRAFLARR